jgi:hypothetical protein
MGAGGYGVQKRLLDPLELKVEEVVSHLMWCGEPSSLRTTSALNSPAISLAPPPSLFLFWCVHRDANACECVGARGQGWRSSSVALYLL